MSSASEYPFISDDAEPATVCDEWLTPVEQASWRAFVDGSHALITALDRALVADSGLSFDEFRILVVLSENPTRRMSDLSSDGLASRSTVSRQVARLVERGDIERLPDSSDARNRLVRISDLGRARLHRAARDHVRLVRRLLLDHLTPAQVDEMGRIFTAVARDVHDVSGGPRRPLS